jgi:hypothetical protein
VTGVPMLATMTRLVLAILLAVAVTACSGTEGDPNNDGSRRDAEAFKKRMDDFAGESLPALQSSVDGEWRGLQAHFYSQGGDFGLWQYTARGRVVSPPGTREEVLDRAARTLAETGMEVEADEDGVHGTLDNIAVDIEPALDTDVDSVSELNVTFRSLEPLDSAGDYAEEAPTTDYTTHLR